MYDKNSLHAIAVCVSYTMFDIAIDFIIYIYIEYYKINDITIKYRLF